MNAVPARAWARPSPREGLRAAVAGLRRHGAPIAIVALAAVLRLVALGRTATDPFYDASVRSMGESWHALVTGAYDPSSRLAIDKAPVDLWLQVVTTKLLGFTPTALLLPAALGGIAAVALVYDLLRVTMSPLAPRAAAAGAAALAVLPVAVITSRSDTMDSVMAALLVAALVVAARGLPGGRPWRMAASGALVGLAFEVKLFEALPVVVPLAVLWWWGAAGSRSRRAGGLAAAAVACVAVGLAWVVAVTALLPASARPWAFGSRDGSPWGAMFVYDGWDRLAGPRLPPAPPGQLPKGAGGRARLAAELARARALRVAAALRAPAPAGPLRLLSGRAHLGARLGLELVGAWLALLGVAATGAWRALPRAGRAGLAALAAWLALGTLLFSAQGELRPRYLEAFDPAVAACLGAGVVLTASALGARWGRRVPAPAVAAIMMALLAGPLAVSVAAAADHVQDSGTPGALPGARLATLTAYLRAHQDGARYEVASVAVAKAGAVIAHDGRPVLMLTASWGHPLVGVGQLARLVGSGQVRYGLVGDSCTPASPDRWAGCSAAARWIRAHGTDVSAAAGQPHRGLLYRLGRAPAASAARAHGTARAASAARVASAARAASTAASAARVASTARAASTSRAPAAAHPPRTAARRALSGPRRRRRR
jgi:4-amino-4-deoxy-L-arabinose transferase-like glycosyltransferase